MRYRLRQTFSAALQNAVVTICTTSNTIFVCLACFLQHTAIVSRSALTVLSLYLLRGFLSEVQIGLSGLRRWSAVACWGFGFEFHRGHGCLCCVLQVKTKGKMQDSQDETRTDEAQSTRGRKPPPPLGGGMDIGLFVSVVCFQVEVSVTGRSLV